MADVTIIGRSVLYADAFEALLVADRYRIVERVALPSQAMTLATPPEAILLIAPVEEGPDSIELLWTRFPSVRIVLVGVADEDSVPWLLSGVAGVVPDYCSGAELCRAFAVALSGGLYLSGRATASLFDRVRVEYALGETNGVRLTAREREIARFLGEGRQNKEIAAELHIEECTVKTHVRSLYKKIGARNRAEATRHLLHLPNG